MKFEEIVEKEVEKKIEQTKNKIDKLLRERCKGKSPELWEEAHQLALVTALATLLVEKNILSENDLTRWKELVEECSEEIYNRRLKELRKLLLESGVPSEDIDEVFKKL